MGDKSAIEWTDATFNPVTGCTKVSPGCAHCYAEAITLRFKRGPAFLPGVAEIKLHPDRLDQPLRWEKPRRVFTCSMADLFHEEVPDDYIEAVFGIMAAAHRHTFQVLTKRPERMRALVQKMTLAGAFLRASLKLTDSGFKRFRSAGLDHPEPYGWPLPNVWLGTSVENQYWADRRIPELLATPAAVRFLSVEPLLKAVYIPGIAPFRRFDGHTQRLIGQGMFNSDQVDSMRTKPELDWVIVGAESGPKRRRFDLEWARDIRDQCVAAGVPFFFKQGSHMSPGQERILDGRTWDEMPETRAQQGQTVMAP